MVGETELRLAHRNADAPAVFSYNYTRRQSQMRSERFGMPTFADRAGPERCDTTGLQPTQVRAPERKAWYHKILVIWRYHISALQPIIELVSVG